MKNKSFIFLPLVLSLPVMISFARADNSRHSVTIGEPIARGQFSTLREPSGITALDQHTFMVIEDEASRALKRLTISPDADISTFEEFSQAPAKGFIRRLAIAPLDDLEGIAKVSTNRFFIIGSHENAGLGTLPAREKILLLTREGDDIASTLLRTDLYEKISSQYPILAEQMEGTRKNSDRALNIEAIAFDRKRQMLHIGFRTPLLNKEAIVISLNNAIDYLEGAEPEFHGTLRTLDLNKNGIRAMAYDDVSDTLLIVSKRESGGNDRSTLWTLAANMSSTPMRYRSEDKNLFRDVEGLTTFADKVIFVRDNGGNTKNGEDQWFVLSRSQLAL